MTMLIDDKTVLQDYSKTRSQAALAAVLTWLAYQSIAGTPFKNWCSAILVGLAVVSGAIFQCSIQRRNK